MNYETDRSVGAVLRAINDTLGPRGAAPVRSVVHEHPFLLVECAGERACIRLRDRNYYRDEGVTPDRAEKTWLWTLEATDWRPAHQMRNLNEIAHRGWTTRPTSCAQRV